MCKYISICVSYSQNMTYSVYDLFIVDCLYKNEFSHVVTIYAEGYCVHKELIDLCNSLWISSFFFCDFFYLLPPSLPFFLPLFASYSQSFFVSHNQSVLIRTLFVTLQVPLFLIHRCVLSAISLLASSVQKLHEHQENI